MEGRPKGDHTASFESLCHAIESGSSSAHRAVQEFMLCKDEILKHSLPSSLLFRLTLVAGKLLRSFSGLQSPVSELIHLVRLYSVPWEEKSEVLKKLHDAAQIKQRQLNIALRKIELFAIQEQRIIRERHIMNWEKLFAKAMNKNSHGRRWKFLIESFKTRLNSGLPIDDTPRFMDKIESYPSSYPRETARKITEAPDASEVDGNRSLSVPVSIASGNTSPATDDGRNARKVHFAVDADAASPSVMGMRTASSLSSDELTFPSATTPSVMSDVTVATGSPSPIALPLPPPVQTTDATTWTNEKQYDRFLHVRVFEPTGLNDKETYCSLAVGPQLVSSRVFGLPEKGKEGGDLTSLQSSSRVLASGSSSMLRASQTRMGLQSSSRSRLKSSSLAKISHEKCDEFRFCVPYEEKVITVKEKEEKGVQEEKPTGFFKSRLSAILATSSMTEMTKKNLSALSLSVHTNKGDKAMIAMATFSFDKLKIEDFTVTSKNIEDVNLLEPSPYQLVPLTGGVGGFAHLVCYWTHQERTWTKTRATMTQPIERVIQSMGYAREITPPQRVDFQVQAFEDEEEIDSTTSTPEGYVRQDEMATLMMRHAKEMEIFQTEYGKRVESLTAALNEMKLQFKHSQKYAGSPAVSSTTLLAKPSSKGNPAPSKLTEKQTPVVRWQKQPSYPEGFLTRLEYFAKASLRRQEALTQKVRDEVASAFEKAMASQHRLDVGHKARSQPQTADEEVCLPAVFMPPQTRMVFTPKAHSYFHPIGCEDQRLTQPPSVFKLPSIPGHVPTLNLFEVSKNFLFNGPDWLWNGKGEDQDHSKTPPPSHVNVLDT